MGKAVIFITGWGTIQCSTTNIEWTFDRQFLKIKTNAINLKIPEELVMIEKGEIINV